jgi:hypothetical protein
LGAALAMGGAASAATLDFEGAEPGSDAAGLGIPDVAVDGGLVLSEAFVAGLLGYPAAGTWNTTQGGANGVLNSLEAVLGIEFGVPITALEADVLALPDAAGDPGVVLLLAFAGSVLVASDLSDPGAIGDSGLPEDTLGVAAAAITRVVFCAPSAAAADQCDPLGLPTTIWADEIRYEPIPEPASLALLGLGVAACAAGRRSR